MQFSSKYQLLKSLGLKTKFFCFRGALGLLHGGRGGLVPSLVAVGSIREQDHVCLVSLEKGNVLEKWLNLAIAMCK